MLTIQSFITSHFEPVIELLDGPLIILKGEGNRPTLDNVTKQLLHV